MGCSDSKPIKGNNASEMLSICKERTRLMKSVIRKRRYFAKAQFKYNESLNSVANALKAFLGSKESFLLTMEPISETKNEKKHESDDEEDEKREICAHFYDDNVHESNFCDNYMGYVGETDGNNFGWDFFNLFDGVKTEVVNGYYGKVVEKQSTETSEETSTSDKHCLVPLLNKTVGDANASLEDSRNVEMFFEALKKVEESFLKSYECGIEVSRMLEISGVHHHGNGLDKFQEIPMKSPFQSIAWGRSVSSSSSSCKSFFALGSPCSSTLTEVDNHYFDENEGMLSGSHSLTLGRLYAWENKLYGELKVGEHIGKTYQQKCWQLKNQDAKCKTPSSQEKIKAEVRDLCSRIMVTIRRIESISQRIEELRVDELHPQLVELLNGLMSTWKTLLETHKAQKEAISEVKKFTHKYFKLSCNDSHRLNTFQLQTEVQNWSFCFAECLLSQKAYAEALNGWLSKFTSPQTKSQSPGKFVLLPSVDVDRSSVMITREWLNFLQNLPEKPVMSAMKSLGRDIRALWVQQGDEQLQKRKIDALTKELDRSLNALQREEKNASYRVEYLNERKRLIDNLKKKVEIEKEKHHDSTEETERNTLRVFQSGFDSVFDSLIEFSLVSLKMYTDLVAESEKKVQK